MSTLRLTLYVAGENPRSTRAILNLRRLRAALPDSRMEVEIVDVLKNPQAAETARILATPALVKDHPPPGRRVIGDLSDPEQILIALAIDPQAVQKPLPPPKDR